MTVYIDMLLIQNLIMNYIILYGTARISKAYVKKIPLLLASIIGAVYAVLIFFPQFMVYQLVSSKVILSITMVCIAYNPKTLKDFMKYLLLFYVTSFVFGGATFGLLYFINTSVVTQNGIIYVGSYSIKILIISTTIAYIVLRGAWELIKLRAVKDNVITNITISLKQKVATIDALIDTGNSLKDPITNTPVIVCEYDTIRDLLPEELSSMYDSGNVDNLGIIGNIKTDVDFISRIRLIPFKSLGTENGLLVGFKPDLLTINYKQGKITTNDVVVGIYNRKLSKDESYRALIGLELVS